MAEEKADRKAYNEILPRLRKGCRQALAYFLVLMRKLQETDMYKKLVQTAEHLMDEEEFSFEEAIQQALRQRKFMFDRLLPEMKKEDSESEEHEEDESDTEEQSD